MNTRRISLPLTLAMLLLLLAGTLLLGAAARAQAPDDPGTLYVSADGDCGGMTPCYDVIQDAADAAVAGDTIKVAMGVYTEVNTYGGLAQIVYVAKDLTIRGGYSTANWDSSDPDANPTVLDAQNTARVIYVSGAVNATVEGLELTGGNASGLGDTGGGLYANGATVTLLNNKVVGNIATATAAGRGGGVALYSGRGVLSGNSFLSNAAVDGHYGSAYGGGAALTTGAFTVTGNLFQDNSASRTSSTAFGGGLFLDRCTALVDDNAFLDNRGSNTLNGGGGGLKIHEGSVMVSNNTFDGNAGGGTSGQGGALDLDMGAGAITVAGNTIVNNRATTGSSPTAISSGGGIYAAGGSAPGLVIRDNLIEGNMTYAAADYAYGLQAGGIKMTGCGILQDNIIRGNSTDALPKGLGGGLYQVPAAAGCAVVSSNIFEDNSARYGGAAYFYASHPSIPIETWWLNNVIVDNSVRLGDGAGSGLYLHHQTGVSPMLNLYLRHTTLARNTGGDGSAIHVDSGTVNGIDTIIAAQAVGVNNVGGSAALDTTLWDGNGANIAGPVSTSNDITGTAAFAPDGYHLTYLSEAVDAGVDASLTTDLDGHPRPMLDTFDIGADEHPYYAVIDPISGGDLIYTDTQDLPTIIQVPPGAITDGIVLLYVPLPAPTQPLPPRKVSAAHTFTLEAYTLSGVHLPGFAFQAPVTVELHYSNADVSRVTEPSLELDAWTGDAWQDAACGLYNRQSAANWLSLPICHLCEFALIGEPYRVYLPLVTRGY